MCGSRRGGQGVLTPLKNHKNIRYLSNTGLDPLKNHKATCTKPAFNVGPPSVASETPFDDCPFIVVFESSIPPPPPINLKNFIKFGIPLTKLSGSAHDIYITCV